MQGRWEKVSISYQYLAIEVKIDEYMRHYMLLCVYPVSKPLFIHVSCDIYRDCPRAYPGEAKMCQTGESIWHIAANISLLIYYSWSYLYTAGE